MLLDHHHRAVPLLLAAALASTYTLDAQQRVTELGLPGSVARRGVVDPTTGEPLLPRASFQPARDWTFSAALRGWQPRAPSSHRPTSTSFFSLTADPSRNRVILFGGSTERVFTGNDETWEWDGSDWQRIATPTAPPPRTVAAACFDSTRGRMVLFGGLHAGASLDDTWEYDGATWIDRTVHPAPAAGAPRLAFDPLRGVSVLRGTDGTWEWDGTTWRGPLDPAPIQTSGAVDLVWDPVSQAVVTTGTGGALEAWNGSVWTSVAGSHTGIGIATVLTVEQGSLRGLLAVDSNTRTWHWDGTRWNHVGSPGAAPGYGVDRMVYDPNRDRLLLLDRECQVFAFDRPSQTWRQQTTTGIWNDGTDICFAYDAARDQLVGFGPGVGLGAPSATWRWDPGNATWQSTTLPVQPTGLTEGMSMEYDLVRERCVLFGGLSTLSDPNPPTWEWDGTQWHRIVTASGPSGRRDAVMVFDSDREVLLMIGNGTTDTWEWDGTTWTFHGLLEPTGATLRPAAVYHAARRRVQVVREPVSTSSRAVLYEIDRDAGSWAPAPLEGDGLESFGAGILWNLEYVPSTGSTYAVYSASFAMRELSSVTAAAAERFGTGCTTSAGTLPELSPIATRLPWLGDRFDYRVASLAPSTRFATLAVGISETQWSGGALPFDLGPLGLTGCRLLVSPDVTLPLSAQAGSALGSLQIPADTSLVSSRAFAQVLALDAAANPGGAVASNALRLTLGSR